MSLCRSGPSSIESIFYWMNESTSCVEGLICLIFYRSCPEYYGSAGNDEVNLERMNKDYNR